MTKKEFIQWLKDRHKAGETLQEIGASLGVIHSTVQRWIKGNRLPSKSMLMLAQGVRDTAGHGKSEERNRT